MTNLCLQVEIFTFKFRNMYGSAFLGKKETKFFWLDKWILHHDNSRSRASLSVKRSFSKEMSVLGHLLYSPAFPSRDLFVFRKQSLV